MNKPLSALILPLLLGLAACNDTTSTIMPVDNRDSIPVNNTHPNTYSGVAIDGYLRNAFVWLDLNNNKRLDTCTLDYADKLTSGVCEPEPSAVTGEGGKFSLDLTAWQERRAALNQALLDPKKYPLALLAIPGATIDEGLIADGNTTVATIQKGYYLLSPPGRQVISPLTTLVKHELDYGVSVVSGDLSDAAHKALRTRLGRGDNYFSNYALDGNEKLHAYARAVTAQIQNHTPEAYHAVLANATMEELATGAKNPYLGDAILLMGRAILSITGQMFNDIDAVVGASATASDYARLNVTSDITLAKVDITLDNKMVLVSQKTEKNQNYVETSGLASLSFTVRNVDTQVSYGWATNGTLNKVSVDGYMQLNYFDDGLQPQRLFFDGSPALAPIGHLYVDSRKPWGAVDGKNDIEITFTHDSSGRTTRQHLKYFTYSGDAAAVAQEKQIEFGYSDNRLVSMTSDEGRVATLNYDGLGRLESVLIKAAGQDSKRSSISYGATNGSAQATVSIENFSGSWVAAPKERQLVTFSGNTSDTPIKYLALDEVFGPTTRNYVWVYEYHGQDEGNLAGLLKERKLYSAKNTGEPITNPQLLVRTSYEYKLLADVIFN